MKIAHVCPFYAPAICGVKQVVEELAKRQVAQGHEVHVYTSDWDKNQTIKKKEEILDGVHVHRCKTLVKFTSFALIWPSVFSKLMKNDFDVIHSHLFGHPHFILAALAAKLKGIKHIHTTHCPWTDAFRSSSAKLGIFFSYNIFSRLALKFTDKIIAITPWETAFIKKYGGKEKQIIVIPNGMADMFFQKIKNNDFKKKHKIPGDFVLFFGRLNITKGPEQFVNIAKLILADKKTKKTDKKHKNLTFVIRGPDEGMRERVKQAIGQEKRILLLPETRDRDEIAKMYQSAEVYVMPSYREGLPLTLFEAMASGLPIVASPVNGIPYEIKQPENGFLVKHGDNEQFKAKILEILNNQALKQKISANNIRKSKNYRWDAIADKIMKLYKS